MPQIKTSDEIQKIKYACQITDKIFIELRKYLSKNTKITEILTPYHGLKDGIIQDMWEKYFIKITTDP